VLPVLGLLPVTWQTRDMTLTFVRTLEKSRALYQLGPNGATGSRRAGAVRSGHQMRHMRQAVSKSLYFKCY